MKKTLLLLTLAASLGAAYSAESYSLPEGQPVTLTFSNTVAAADPNATLSYGSCKGIAFTLTNDPSRLTITGDGSGDVPSFNVFDLESISLKVNDAWAATGAYLIDDTSNQVVALSSVALESVAAGEMATFTFGNVPLKVDNSYKLFFVNKDDMSNSSISVGTTLTISTLSQLRSVGMLLSGMQAETQPECGFTNDVDSYAGNTSTYAPIVSIQGQARFIPEPATATLSLLALMGLAARRRRG